jgi:hypothetical protein
MSVPERINAKNSNKEFIHIIAPGTEDLNDLKQYPNSRDAASTSS